MAGIGHNKPYVGVNSLSSEDKKKIKNAITELDASLTRIAAEREHQKTIVNDINEELGIDKKLLKRMARAHFQANFKNVVEDNETFEEFYEMIVNSNETD
jgi:uncharacterized protein YukE